MKDPTIFLVPKFFGNLQNLDWCNSGTHILIQYMQVPIVMLHATFRSSKYRQVYTKLSDMEVTAAKPLKSISLPAEPFVA